jgi:hypothetical protein
LLWLQSVEKLARFKTLYDLHNLLDNEYKITEELEGKAYVSYSLSKETAKYQLQEWIKKAREAQLTRRRVVTLNGCLESEYLGE